MPIGEAIKGFRFWFILVAVFLVAASVNGTIAHIVPILTDRGISVGVGNVSAFGDRDRANRRENSERFLSGPLFRALRRGVLLLLAADGNRSAEQRRRGIVPFLGTVCLGMGIGSEIDIMAFLVGRYFGVRTFGEIYGWIMGVFVFASGLGPTIMGVCYDRTHSYNLALEGFAASLAVASILISRLGPYAFPAPRDIAVPQTAPAALTD